MMLKVGIIIAQIQYLIRLDRVLIFFCLWARGPGLSQVRNTSVGFDNEVT